jgi:adenylate cyclase
VAHIEWHQQLTRTRRAADDPRVRAPEQLTRLLAIADEPSDDDDLRLRKRVGVLAGLFTIVAPLTLPSQADFRPFAVALALGLSSFAIVNLVVLWRTHRFERFLIALIGAGVVFVPLASFSSGGLMGAGTGLVWAFLVPAYAILAIGPRRAVPWFFVYVVSVLFMVVTDPVARSLVPSVPYAQFLVGSALGTLMPLSIVFVLLWFTDVRRREAEARVDELLTNAIPASIARRLRHGEQRIAEAYPATTVLFSDIVGFTPWAQATDPARVVDLLDRLFSRFDELAADCGVEKIKTIGDAYMAAAGVPVPREDHAEAALGLAVRMLDAVESLRAAEKVPLEVRIGLASGAVVAGVIGRRRILFDLWGDTVNTAARMESSGVPGRVQVTAATRALLGAAWPFEERSVDVKGLGRMTTYVLQRSEGVTPATQQAGMLAE